MKPTRQPDRTEFILLISVVTALTAFSIDALLPVLRQIGETTGHGDVGQTQLIISLFILGIVFGEIVFGPLSDAIGRIKSIAIGLGIYIVGCGIAWSATSFEWILVGRIVQGIGVAAPKIIARAIVRDRFAGDEMARILSFIFVVFITVPMLAPAVGQLVARAAGWQAIFVMFSLWALAAGCWLVGRQPETLALKDRIPFRPGVIWRNATLIVAHRPVLLLTAASGLVFGAILLYVGLAQAIFTEIYQTGDNFVWWFALLASSIGFTSFLNGRLVVRMGAERMAQIALIVMGTTSALQILIAFVQDGQMSFVLFIATSFVIFGCFGLLFGNLSAVAMQWLGRIAGLGAAVVSAIASLIAAAYSTAAAQFFTGSVILLAAAFFITACACLWLLARAKRHHSTEIEPER